jgi:hypothetical protein
MTVTISSRQVKLSANGQTQFMDSPDPVFAGGTHIAPEQMRLKARQAREVTITVDVPGVCVPTTTSSASSSAP